MARRLMLDKELCEVLQEGCGQEAGKERIYFQPPSSVLMDFNRGGAIRYKKNSFSVRYADNMAHIVEDEYEVIFITRDPDSPVPRMIQERFQKCRAGRNYTADNLYHHPFTIYY